MTCDGSILGWTFVQRPTASQRLYYRPLKWFLGGGDPAGLFRGSSIAVWYQFNGWWLPIEKDVNWIRFHPRRTEKAARGQHRDKNECFPFEKNILKMLCPILARVSNVPMLGPENLVPKYGSHSTRNFNQIAIRRRGRLSIQLSVSLKP